MNKPLAPVAGEKYRILLVEDEIDIARMLVALLSSFDLECRCAFDGASALREYSAWQPHLVLLDVMLPGLSGHDVCTKIRESDSVPIIILSALGETESELTGLKLGADDYISKPYSPRVLAARVVTHLRRAYRYDACAGAASSVEEETSGDGLKATTEMDAAVAALAAQNGLPLSAIEPPSSEHVPVGWASCERCGYMGPRQRFESENALGKPKARCPVCKESDYVAFSLG
jgi:DNA-binding response OmpR family regulator